MGQDEYGVGLDFYCHCHPMMMMTMAKILACRLRVTHSGFSQSQCLLKLLLMIMMISMVRMNIMVNDDHYENGDE